VKQAEKLKSRKIKDDDGGVGVGVCDGV